MSLILFDILYFYVKKYIHNLKIAKILIYVGLFLKLNLCNIIVKVN